mmetsp:Transcript_18173/g.38513  ORF Transcript_18173/g.38513 Transcript_18173/m.38513 type:complete len:386 (+) Transcript_18173:329-1486(+)
MKQGLCATRPGGCLAELGLGKRVEQGAENGNGRANNAQGGDRRLEGDHRGDDDDDALDRVADGVGHRVDAAEREEGDLVVEVVEGAREERLLPEVPEGEALVEGGGDGGHDGGGRLEHERDGHHRNEREDGQHAVEVGLAHVLTDAVAAHRLLREDASEGGGEVGAHRRDESEPGEGELLERCERDAADDGQQREVGDGRVEGAEEQRREGGGDDRLRRLDDVREGDGACAEGDDGANVRAQVAERDRDERLHVLGRELGRLTDAGEPEREAIRDAHEELQGGHRVRDRQRVQRLLVVDVVPNVEEIPEGKEAAGRESLQQRVLGSHLWLLLLNRLRRIFARHGCILHEDVGRALGEKRQRGGTQTRAWHHGRDCVGAGHSARHR